MFSQKVDDEGNARFFIGEFPEEILKDRKNYSTCSAARNEDNERVSTYWTCDAGYVYINEKQVDQSSDPLIFDTGVNVIVAPTKLFRAFKSLYFEKYLGKGCTAVEDYSSGSGFKCDGIHEDFPTIYIVENGILYPIEDKHLFDPEEEGSKMFKIISQ
jgi:hypothetical protein